MTPWDRACLDPRAFISTNLVDTHENMFHAKYLSSRSFCFLQKKIVCFYYIHVTKPMTPTPWGEVNFDPNFCRVSLDAAACKISKL
jgi:hypothetical protein